LIWHAFCNEFYQPMMTLWQYLRLLSARLLRWSLLSMVVGALMLIAGWRSAGRKEAALMTWEQVSSEARKLKRILWANFGLDVLYIAGGLVLTLKIEADNPFWSGTGWGIVVQGAFLLFFDAFHAHQLNRECVGI
jgi:hypothetical protein